MKKQEMIDELKARKVVFKDNITVKELEELLKASEPTKTILQTTGEPKLSESASTAETPKIDKLEVKEDEQKFVKISKEDWKNVQNQLKMLYDVADKGRVFNYESQQQKDKKPVKVKLSILNGLIITGWRTLKDELFKDSRTGRTIGETQQYEVSLLDEEGKTTNVILDGYVAFSNARYDKRIEVEVVGKKEDWDGSLTFNVRLPNGRVVSLDGRCVN
jgi:hypothetical protein